jgi:hypothetical protein
MKFLQNKLTKAFLFTALVVLFFVLGILSATINSYDYVVALIVVSIGAVAFGVGSLLAEYSSWGSLVLKFQGALGMMLFPFLLFLFSWNYLKNGGLAYGTIPVARTGTLWRGIFPAASLLLTLVGIKFNEKVLRNIGLVFLLIAAVLTFQRVYRGWELNPHVKVIPERVWSIFTN